MGVPREVPGRHIGAHAAAVMLLLIADYDISG